MDARDLHARAIVIDGVDPSVPTRARFLRMRDAGVTAANVTLAIHENQTEAARALAMWDRLVARERGHRASCRRRRTTSGPPRGERRVGLIYGFQNGTPFEDEVGFVEQFARLGVRIVQPAYMTQNAIGCGCLEPVDSGLSMFGKDVIRELNTQGVTIDLSHCGPRTTIDAIETSSRPVLFTTRIRASSSTTRATSRTSNSSRSPRRAGWWAQLHSGASSRPDTERSARRSLDHRLPGRFGIDRVDPSGSARAASAFVRMRRPA